MSSGCDYLLHEVSREIADKEREIIDQFCKTFIAYKSIEGIPISEVFDRYTLCVNHDFSKSFVSRYWFEKRVKDE